MKLSIVKYNAGNIQSVAFALERLGVDFDITDDTETLLKSDKILFPGVGEASTTMQHLKQRNLDKLIKDFKQPVLGVCLGMQLMCKFSEENNTDCLGIFDETVRRFNGNEGLKVPHMGWNQLKLSDNWLARNLEGENVYFVHSFYVPVNQYTSAVTEYGIPFSAAMKKNNFYAVQFHPEKSAQGGEQVLKSFLDL